MSNKLTHYLIDLLDGVVDYDMLLGGSCADQLSPLQFLVLVELARYRDWRHNGRYAYSSKFFNIRATTPT